MKLKSTKIRRFAKPILNDHSVRKELASLHRDYVFVPTDKAQNNISIICKKYYLDVLKQEMCSDTYEKIDDDDEQNIVNRHVSDLKNVTLEVDEDERRLPFIYWTAKQHKVPTGARFIVSGKKCSTKSLSKRLLKIFKLVQKTLKSYCRYKCNFLKTSSFWVIDNSKPIHSNINYLNLRGKAKSIFTYDFTQLYTNIPHDLLVSQIQFVLDEAFKIKAESYANKPAELYVKVNKSTATWSDKIVKNAKAHYMSKTDIMESFKYLINNIYVKFNNTIYRQTVGIPMGTDCAPDLANIFLFSYEYKYVCCLIESGSGDVSKFRYIHRYIDDLITLNDMGYFNSIFKNIYPSALELKNTTTSPTETNYLDMNIRIDSGNKFICQLYDKRNDFNFNVVSMPNLSSNVPIDASYSVFYSQIIRIFKANNSMSQLHIDIKNMMDKLCKQNFKYSKLVHQVYKFKNNYYFDIMSKYWEGLRMNLL